jgi:hypothetical protein
MTGIVSTDRAGSGEGHGSIEADPNAEPFYLRMGARRVGEITRAWGGEVRRTLPYLRVVAGGPREI